MKLNTEYKIPGEIEGAHHEPETDSYARGVDHLRYKKSIRRHHRARIINKRLKRVKEGKYSYKDPIWTRISKQAKDLIDKMLVYDPSRRLSAK